MRSENSSKYSFFGLLALAALAVLLRRVLLMIFFGLLIGMVFNLPIRRLQKLMGRGPAMLITLFLFLGLIGGTGYFGLRPMAAQARTVKDRAPEAIKKAEAWLQQAEGKPPAADKDGGAQGPGGGAETLKSLGAKGGEAAMGLSEVLTGVVMIIALAAFFSHEPQVYRDGLKTLVPKSREDDFDELWKRLTKGLESWLGGILKSMAIMGGLTALGLLAAGIKEWAFLGFLTFLGTFVPYLGAIASAVPGLLFAATDSGRKLLYAAAVYAGVHLVEGYVVQPLVMRKAADSRPALQLGWQLAFGTLCGTMGLVVATPVLVVVQITVDYLYVEKKLGKQGSGLGKS